jgi:hypothetical protein
VNIVPLTWGKATDPPVTTGVGNKWSHTSASMTTFLTEQKDNLASNLQRETRKCLSLPLNATSCLSSGVKTSLVAITTYIKPSLLVSFRDLAWRKVGKLAQCFKKSFTVVFQMLLCGDCYENFRTYESTNYPPLNTLYACKFFFCVNFFVTLATQ